MKKSTYQWSQFIYIILNILFIAFVTFIFSMQCSLNLWYNGEPGTDSSVFKTVAMMLDKGYAPYLDTFDHKGPLLYLFNWFGMQLSYYRGNWIIEYIILFITFFYVYKILRLFCGRLLSCIMLLIVVAALFPQFEGGNLVEEYAMPFIAVSLYFYTEYFLSAQIHFLKVILCGLCFGAVCMLRPNMIPVWAVFSVIVLIKCFIEKEYKKMGKFTSLFLAGAALIILPIFIWLWRLGAFTEFFNDYILFNLRYSEAGTQRPGAQIEAFFSFFSETLVLCLIILVVYLFVKHRDYLAMGYGISILLSLCAISMSGAKYAHYAMILVPLYSYPLGILGEWIQNAVKGKDKALGFCILAYLFIVLALPSWRNGVIRMINSYEARGENCRSEVTTNVVNYVTKNTEENEKITVWGNWNIIYVLSQRIPASKYSYQQPIGEIAPEIYEEYFAQLSEENPKLIIVRKDGTEQPMLNYIEEHDYKKVFESASEPLTYIYTK